MSGDRLVDGYALVVFDLDGVIYLIDQPIPGAVETVARLHGEGRAVAYATNNASRRAADVADLLTGMGVPARPEEVLTSAAAAAQLLGERLPAGAKVVGAEALRAEISEAGLKPVATADEAPVAVIQGVRPAGGLGRSGRGGGGGTGRRDLGGHEHRPHPAQRAWPRCPATAPWWPRWPPRSAGTRTRSSASPHPSCSPPPLGGRTVAGRWSWVTGWTPTSRARTGPAWTACWSSPGSVTPPSCSPRPPSDGRRTSRGT